jgi:hypothetical protein
MAGLWHFDIWSLFLFFHICLELLLYALTKAQGNWVLNDVSYDLFTWVGRFLTQVNHAAEIGYRLG